MRKYQTVADFFIEKIKSGQLKEGEKLPSLRAICTEFDVSLNTAVRAINILEDKKFVLVKNKARAVVLPQVLNPQKRESRVFDNPRADRLNSFFPVSQELKRQKSPEWLAQLQGKFFQFFYQAHQHPEALRLSPQLLREAICFFLKKQNGDLEPDQVFILSGRIQAFNLLAYALVTPDTCIFYPQMSYAHCYCLGATFTRNCFPIPYEAEGLYFPASFDASKRSLVYIQPVGAFPTNEHLDAYNLAKIRRLSLFKGFLLLEDKIDDCFYPETTPSFFQENSLILGGVPEEIFPFFGLTWLVVPKKLVAIFEQSYRYLFGGATIPAFLCSSVAKCFKDDEVTTWLSEVAKENVRHKILAKKLLQKTLGKCSSFEQEQPHCGFWIRTFSPIPQLPPNTEGILLGTSLGCNDNHHVLISTLCSLEEFQNNCSNLLKILGE